MKNYLLGLLFLTLHLPAYSQDPATQQGSSMMEQVQQMMKEVTENDLLSNLNEQERQLYQQMNAEQKSLVLGIANRFSCHAHIQTMKKKMQEKFNQKEATNSAL